MEPSFFDLNWFAYILGFLLLPRITMIVIFSVHVTDGFKWYNLFVYITIFWKYEMLGLGSLSKTAFSFLLTFLPRTLLAVVGYLYLDNPGLMIVLGIIGFAIDVGGKFLRRATQES